MKNPFVEFDKLCREDETLNRIMDELTPFEVLHTAYEGLFGAIHKLTALYVTLRERCKLCTGPGREGACGHCLAGDLQVEDLAKRTVLAQVMKKHAVKREIGS